MSGSIPSSFGNAAQNFLYNPLLAQTQTSNQNALTIQQQDISGHELEMGARLAGTLLSAYDTPEARAAAYPTLLAQARQVAPGYFKNAPSVYPGDEPTRALARLGTPSADLFKLGVDRQAKGAIAPGDGGTTATGGGGGGGAGGGTAGDGLTGDKAHDLPLIAQRESGGNPTVLNYVARGDPTAYARGATASGKYQIVNSTWREGMQLAGLDPAQYATARDAPEAVQDKVASAIYDKYGAKPWQKGATDWVRDEQGRYQLATVRPPAGAPGGAPSVTAPGAPAAPGVVMGQVGRPGDVPPPPGGAPGAYPGTGGGFGAVVGRPAAVSGTTVPAGRPTGPPVITDQPAGSNVVAGPPGVATVGAPQPPSPEVPGNVAAINAGIVARGGQPATDPNLTPTPARYAGTAPAPSAEAAPEPGWGSQVGSGYGPQNTLAPAPVPAAPARPAVPAQPAATQPPAADTLPPLPAPTPPAPTNRNGLTPAQQQDINNRRNLPNVSADELQKRVDAYVSTNAAAAEKFQQDQIAYVREARERQSSAQAQQDRAQAQQLAREAAQRDAERLKIAQDAAQAARRKADQEAVDANKPFHGNTPDAQNRNILIEGTNSGKTDTTEYQSAYADYGTEKVDANGLKYRPDMSPYATPTGKTYGEGRGGRDLGKADVGQGPLPPPVIHTAIQGNLAGLRNVDRALRELNAHPDSVGVTGLQPDWLSQRTDPEGIKLRAEISDILSQIFHERSGAAVMISEAARMKPFTPVQTDTAVALRTKLERIRQNYLDTLYDHYSTYGPEGGGRAMPRVETALKGYSPGTDTPSLPQAKTEADVKALPSGAVFIAPDGTRRVKP